MSQSYHDLIYPDSPFLPRITPELLDKINREQIDKRFTPFYASQLIWEVALDQNTMQKEEYDWIKSNFHATDMDLVLYMHGLCIAPVLVVGAYIIDKFNFKIAIQKICPPAIDRLQLELNRYKSNHLLEAYNLYQNNHKRFQEIFDYALKNPFSSNLYFLAGIAASQSLYVSLVENINQSSP